MHRCRPYRFMNPLSGIFGAHIVTPCYRAASPGGDGRWFAATKTHSLAHPLTVPGPLPPVRWTFTFSAKEKDTETGLSVTSLRSVSSFSLSQSQTSLVWHSLMRRFGARYYSSDLSIWLSVDPQASKYPSLSPYVYCADNPVKLVDPNGEDFETEIDYDNKTITITIKATYYTANCNKELLQKGVDMWNNQSGMYSYVMGEGDNAVSCTIKFELLIAEGNFETDADAFKAMPMGQSSNFVSLIDNVLDDNENEVRGKCDGKIAYISKNHSLFGFNQSRTMAHELGHTLGCGDMSVRGDLMESGGFGSSISTNDIRSIMYMAGYDNLGAIRVSQGKSCDKPQSGDFTGYVRKN